MVQFPSWPPLRICPLPAQLGRMSTLISHWISLHIRKWSKQSCFIKWPGKGVLGCELWSREYSKYLTSCFFFTGSTCPFILLLLSATMSDRGTRTSNHLFTGDVVSRKDHKNISEAPLVKDVEVVSDAGCTHPRLASVGECRYDQMLYTRYSKFST